MKKVGQYDGPCAGGCFASEPGTEPFGGMLSKSWKKRRKQTSRQRNRRRRSLRAALRAAVLTLRSPRPRV